MGGLIEARRRILLNTPHLESVSGNVASFQTDLRGKLKECKVYFSPVQEGTGEPSPSNVRPINGWSGLVLKESGTDSSSPSEIPISWVDIGTKYGGNVDLVSGEMIITYEYIRLDAETLCNEFRVQSSGLYTVWSVVNGMKSGRYASDKNVLCDKAIKVANRADVPNTKLGILLGNNNSSIYLYNMNTVYNLTTKGQISAWLSENPIHVTVPLNAPVSYQLTPQTLKSLKGRNNIWSDAGEVEVTYWTH